jgi:hypothetical protein
MIIINYPNIYSKSAKMMKFKFSIELKSVLKKNLDKNTPFNFKLGIYWPFSHSYLKHR